MYFEHVVKCKLQEGRRRGPPPPVRPRGDKLSESNKAEVMEVVTLRRDKYPDLIDEKMSLVPDDPKLKNPNHQMSQQNWRQES